MPYPTKINVGDGACQHPAPTKSVGDTSIAIRQSPARRANIECDLSHTRGPGAQPLVIVIKLRDQFGHFASPRTSVRVPYLITWGPHKTCFMG